MDSLSVRELEEKDIDHIIQYFLEADHSFLVGMGVDVNKLPDKNEWRMKLLDQLNIPIEQKQIYYTIWMLNGLPIGHSNINRINFASDAFMHLHMWNAGIRKKGIGTDLVKMSLPHFFEKFKLQKLYCEPYALNPAPNAVLKKIGFHFVKKYVTTPGWINFEQPVNLWELNRDILGSLSPG